MKLTKAQQEIYYRITSDLEDYDKEKTIDNIIDELKHQIETELWHKDEYDDSYSGLNIKVAKNLLNVLMQEQSNKKYVKGSGKGRGGWRGGGRPKGTKTRKTLYFTKAITPEEKEYLEKCLNEYRLKNGN